MCTPCDNSCKTCLSGSANNCLNCYDYSDFTLTNISTNEGSCSCKIGFYTVTIDNPCTNRALCT